MSDRIPMTRAGYDKLKAEVDQFETVEMPKLAQRVAAARRGLQRGAGADAELRCQARTDADNATRSLAILAANSTGVVGSGSKPAAMRRERTASSRSATPMAALALVITSPGRPAGPNRPTQLVTSKPGKPLSAKLGNSGSATDRRAPVLAM